MFFPQRPRPALVILTFAIPVFGNLALEAIGLAATTTSVEGGHLVVTSAVVATDPTATLVGFAFRRLVLVSVAGVMATVLSTSPPPPHPRPRRPGLEDQGPRRAPPLPQQTEITSHSPLDARQTVWHIPPTSERRRTLMRGGAAW
ncbi:MAG: hypothetical protein IPL61_00835 [Myxococcales bacterium]|nr:hypothetical protein [Myxococcales bacterium]